MEPISLVCIAWNEEGGLRQMIESAKPIVDEIIVMIDNKTTDKTEEIAREMGAKVSHFDWEFDFSKHRNAAAALAKAMVDRNSIIQLRGPPSTATRTTGEWSDCR